MWWLVFFFFFLFFFFWLFFCFCFCFFWGLGLTHLVGRGNMVLGVGVGRMGLVRLLGFLVGYHAWLLLMVGVARDA
ncbi:hypothetical protein PUR28_00075, partial [Streptomyces sp. BE308]|uniref:hypothetical protein n=1 Tax=Streptomyces sp. BE308 TaxID=3002529 RepID=UPI002E7A11EC